MPAKRERRLLDRKEFERRVRDRARHRYGLELPESWFAELIEGGLIDWADRDANEGLRPVYRRGRRAYRRALQIARFRRDDIVEHDAIRIQMFLRGYGNIRDIRAPLANQYIRFGKGLLAQVRSGYADNWRDVPEGHKRSLLKAMGPLDEELDAGGFQLPDDVYIQGLRSGKQHPVDLDNFDVDRFLNDLANGHSLFQSMAPLLMGLFDGSLMFDGVQSEDSGDEIDDIEQLIRRATDEGYERARDFYWIGLAAIGSGVLPTSADIEARRKACRKVGDAVKRSPKWTASILVLGLIVARRFPIHFKRDDANFLLRRMGEKDLTFEQLITSVISDNISELL